MKRIDLLAASAIALVYATPAFAQDTANTNAGPDQPQTAAQAGVATPAPNDATATTAEGAAADQTGGIQDIVVTAQRQSERLQDVPIAVSAFTAKNLEQQQIVNPAKHGGVAPERQLHQDQLHVVELHHPRHRRPLHGYDLRQRDRDPRQRHAAGLDASVRERVLRP